MFYQQQLVNFGSKLSQNGCKKQKISFIYCQEMMFCGACTTDNEKQHEVQIRDIMNTAVFQRVSRQNEQMMISAMKQIGNFAMIIPSKYQQHLRKCKQKNVKFTDTQFPPSPESLSFSMHNRKIVWKRITQIIEKPEIITGDTNPKDINQGNVGDCYFLATIASIAQNPERIYKIFCNQLDVCPQGIYRFQIVHEGQFKQIIIDDYVPVYEGSNRPVFCRAVGGEVWVMLLEKLWAKLSGSYGNISAGYPHEVLNTFLVAPCFYYQIEISLLKDERRKSQLWQKIKQGSDRNMPMVGGSRQAYTCKGFKPGHSYSVLQAFQVTIDRKQFRLIRLRNPWGESQYLGKYSQHDRQFWDKISNTQLKQKLNQAEEDGIFTVELDQFIRNFECLDISHDTPNNHYFYIKGETKSYKPCFFRLKVQTQGSLGCYITAEKAFDRNQYVKTRRVEYGHTRILLAKVKNIEINNKMMQTYEYVDSILQANFPDVTLRMRNLQTGDYILMADSQFPDDKEGTLNISVYSQSLLNLEKTVGPDLFLHTVLVNYAHNCHVSNRTLLSESSQDWMISNFLLKQGGYGFILVCLGPNSTQKVQITGNIKKIKESGFVVLQRKQKQEIRITVGPNQQSIVIFGIDFTQRIDNIKFPPKGLRIAKVL